MSIEDLKNQRVLEQLSSQPVPVINQIPHTQSVCPQCGLLHPPLPQGEKCPNAPIKTESGEILDLNNFFNQLKNICLSQIESKKIKDTKKLFNTVIIEVTKCLESYKE